MKTKQLKNSNSKPNKTNKETFQYNKLREEFAGTPNPNQEIASKALQKAYKDRLSRNKAKEELKENRTEKEKIDKLIEKSQKSSAVKALEGVVKRRLEQARVFKF